MHNTCDTNYRIVNEHGRVLLATTSAYTAVRLSLTATFAGVVQILVFGEWVTLDDDAA